jgi:signal transduction histidine kinase
MTSTPVPGAAAPVRGAVSGSTAVRLRPYLVPAIIAAVLWLVAMSTVPADDGGWSRVVDGGLWYLYPILTWLLVVVASVLLVVPILVAVTRPVLATVLAMVAFVVPVMIGGHWLVASYLVLAAVTYVCARSSWQTGLIPLAAASVGVVLLVITGQDNVIMSTAGATTSTTLTSSSPYRNVTVAAVFTIGPLVGYALGIAAGTFGAARTKDQVLAARIGEVDAAAAVNAERARLARDLHDVVAHHVSLIAVRAETAPYALGDPSPQVSTVLAEIAQGARVALDELRTILGVLRRTDGETAERAPQPTLSEIHQLVAAAGEAGQQVQLTWAVDADRVNDAVGLVAYRVVQEALTNARSHAPGSLVNVDVRVIGDALHVRVANDRPELRPQARTDVRLRGYGLVGLRERVEAVGGQLSAGRTPDGGFLLDARFPLSGPAR